MKAQIQETESASKKQHKSIFDRDNLPLLLLSLMGPAVISIFFGFVSGPKTGVVVFSAFILFIVAMNLWYMTFGEISQKAKQEVEDAAVEFFGKFFWLAFAAFIFYAIVR